MIEHGTVDIQAIAPRFIQGSRAAQSRQQRKPGFLQQVFRVVGHSISGFCAEGQHHILKRTFLRLEEGGLLLS